MNDVHPLAEPFRISQRGLAASVTIISTQVGSVRYGMVATAVMSLSMEPPSLVIAVNSAASIHAPLVRTRAFVVNILSAKDERVVRGFAKASGEARFVHGDWSSRRAGPAEASELPYLANAQATIFCRVQNVHQGGTHTLFVAEVQDVIVGKEKSPLIYCDGTYGAFAPVATQVALEVGAALTLSPLASDLAKADSKSIVLVNWGGDSLKGMQHAFAAPYEKATGIKVLVDTSGPSATNIRAMVQSGRITWDICDATVSASMELGEAGLLEEIDYSIIDPSLTLPQFAYTWGVGSYVYSSVIAYNKAKFKDNPPSSWADFWNIKDFPGRRLLRADLPSMLEAALMADGVNPQHLYPLDVNRGFAKIREIKKHCVFWRTAAESEQFLLAEEVVMGNIWSTRAIPLMRETNGRISMTWNQGILQPAVWVVPKGNPAGREAAMKLIAFMQRPEPSIEFSRVIFGGPASPRAAAALPEDMRPLVPTAPENIKLQATMDGRWYAANYAKLLPQYLDLIAS